MDAIHDGALYNRVHPLKGVDVSFTHGDVREAVEPVVIGDEADDAATALVAVDVGVADGMSLGDVE